MHYLFYKNHFVLIFGEVEIVLPYKFWLDMLFCVMPKVNNSLSYPVPFHLLVLWLGKFSVIPYTGYVTTFRKDNLVCILGFQDHEIRLQLVKLVFIDENIDPHRNIRQNLSNQQKFLRK